MPPTFSDDRRSLLRSAAVAAGASLMPPGIANAAVGTATPGWDLTDLYETEAAWEADRSAARELIARAGSYKGRLGESATILADALEAQSGARRAIARLATYATAKAAEDTTNASNQKRAQLASQLSSDFGRAVAFTSPQLVRLGRATIDEFVAANADLAKYRVQLDDALRLADHTLGEEAERVIAATTAPFAGPLAVATQLNASDIPRSTVLLSDGRSVLMDEQGYDAAAEGPVRSDRKRAYEAFYASLSPFESTLGADLLAQVQQEVFTAQMRNYPDPLSAALGPLGIPPEVYRTFVREAREARPVLSRYLDLRRRLLGVDQLAIYDLYAPLGSVSRRFTLADMRANLLDATAPLGRDYGRKLAAATAARWSDPFPRKNKLPGNYNDPGAYDVHPYVMLNLTDSYSSMSNYAHEWGHAMHSVLIARSQPYETSRVTNFIAEVPSQLNEILLARHMAASAATTSDRLFYLLQLIELWVSHFLTVGIVAEFQDRIHLPIEQGGTLTGRDMSAEYLRIMRAYYRSDVLVDDLYGVGWGRNYQLWGGYYSFQYATSITAAGVFAEAIGAGEPGARDRYLSLLSSGGSRSAYDLLRNAGVDLATPSPYRRAVTSIGELIDEATRLSG